MMTTMAALLGALPLALGHRHRLRAAPAARHRHRRRADREPDADALHDAGRLPLSRSPAAALVRGAQRSAAARAAPAPTRGAEAVRRHDVGASRGSLRSLAVAAARERLRGRARTTCGPRWSAPDAYKEHGRLEDRPPAGRRLLRGPWWELFGDPALNALEARVSVANQNLVGGGGAATGRRARSCARRAPAYFPTATLGRRLHALPPVGERSASLSGTAASGTGTGDRSARADRLPAAARHLVGAGPLGQGPPHGRVEPGQRAGERRRSGDRAPEPPGRAGPGLLPAPHARRPEAAARRDGRRLRAVARADPEPLRGGVASQADVAQARDPAQEPRRRRRSTSACSARSSSTPSRCSSASRRRPSRCRPRRSPPRRPAIPVGVPSELLERRPDVAAAERGVAAANAQIGVAIAAFYPTVTLSASGGFESSGIATWFTWPSRFWSVGPAISQTVFDGGLRRAQTDAGARGLRRERRHLPSDRADRVPGGGGQPGRAAHPARTRRACRTRR